MNTITPPTTLAESPRGEVEDQLPADALRALEMAQPNARGTLEALGAGATEAAGSIAPTLSSDPERHEPLQISGATGLTDRAAWARYVERFPGASLFHHPDWSEAVQRVFGHTPRHLLARRAADVVGVLPLVEVRSLFGGRMLISVPYGTYGGMLADNADACAALARSAADVANHTGARVLELRSAAALAPGFEELPGYVGFLRELPTRAADVAATLPKRARAAARHARDRDGMVVRHGVEQLPIVWNLYCRSMRRIGSVNYPIALFHELHTRLGARMWVALAWAGKQPVCGTVCFVFRNTIMPYVLGADERLRGDGAANLLYWSLMECAVAAGLRWFDYGRSRADNVGAVAFKKNQGFEPRALDYQRYVPPGCRAPNLRPDNPRFALARRVWSHLPLRITRPLGAALARSLPG